MEAPSSVANLMVMAVSTELFEKRSYRFREPACVSHASRNLGGVVSYSVYVCKYE